MERGGVAGIGGGCRDREEHEEERSGIGRQQRRFYVRAGVSWNLAAAVPAPLICLVDRWRPTALSLSWLGRRGGGGWSSSWSFYLRGRFLNSGGSDERVGIHSQEESQVTSVEANEYCPSWRRGNTRRERERERERESVCVCVCVSRRWL